jgi:signal transduction histidine kinase
MLRGTKRLELIERSADRMQHMIDDLLEMATIQAGGLTLNRIPEEAERIVAGIVDAYETTAAALGLTLVPQFDLEGVQLLCDRNRIERVFGNLIGNALKYCRRGDMIFLRGRVIDDRVLFSVADTGPGIAAEDREHLFEPYWTARRHGGKPGTGLGLYISKGIIEAHGGELWVESQPGVGTEFFFRLPLAGEARPHRGEAGPSPPTQH